MTPGWKKNMCTLQMFMNDMHTFIIRFLYFF
jgi:hypothetical protein